MPAVKRDESLSCVGGGGGGGDVRWSTLLPELLVPILQRVPTVRDRIRFGSVCRWWRSVLTEARRLLPPTAPLLLLPYTEEEPRRRREVHGIPSHWVHRVLLPDSQYITSDGCHHRPKKVICGSSMGWLLVIDGGGGGGGGGGVDAHLWNPTTGEEEIPLPRNFPCRHKLRVDKVVLSSTPCSTTTTTSSSGHQLPPQGCCCCCCCTVMVLRKCCQELCFCRIGDDDRWTTFEARIRYQDVICYRAQFYAVTYGGGVVMLDVGPNPKMEVATTSRTTYPAEGDIIGYYFKNYLVESSGELLRLTRWIMDDDDDSDKKRKLITNNADNKTRTFSTIKFEVHKLDLDTKTWSKVVSLGDQALFLGKSSSVSFAATTADGHRRNCIYFLDDDYDPCFPSFCWESDMGVFDLEDGSITTFGIDKHACSSNKNCTSLIYCPQFWIDLAP